MKKETIFDVSDIGFRFYGNQLSFNGSQVIFYAAHISTLLGDMIAVSDEKHLLLLEFVDRKGLLKEIEHLQKHMNASIVMGTTDPLLLIARELADYFAGTLVVFKTPIRFFGSLFCQRVWHELAHIPFGHTHSYVELATSIGSIQSCRAVARANSLNRLAIIVPCHRVINKSGAIGGYASGIERKAWLLSHEKEKNA